MRSVCAGAFFSLFIAKPNEALEQIPIYPDAVPSYTGCAECFEYRPDHDPIMCGKVRLPVSPPRS
jgi:hypothetical protein